jgi:hypothetical protein
LTTIVVEAVKRLVTNQLTTIVVEASRRFDTPAIQQQDQANRRRLGQEILNGIKENFPELATQDNIQGAVVVVVVMT